MLVTCDRTVQYVSHFNYSTITDHLSSLEWEWEGMEINSGNGTGMGIKSEASWKWDWEWDEMGMLQAIPAHLYCTHNGIDESRLHYNTLDQSNMTQHDTTDRLTDLKSLPRQ